MATTGKKLIRLQQQVESAKRVYRCALNAAENARDKFAVDSATDESQIALVSAEHELSHAVLELCQARGALAAAR